MMTCILQCEMERIATRKPLCCPTTITSVGKCVLLSMGRSTVSKLSQVPFILSHDKIHQLIWRNRLDAKKFDLQDRWDRDGTRARESSVGIPLPDVLGCVLRQPLRLPQGAAAARVLGTDGTADTVVPELLVNSHQLIHHFRISQWFVLLSVRQTYVVFNEPSARIKL